MGKVIPTLNVVGYIDSVPEKAEEAMLNFFFSRPHQTLIYPNMMPLPAIVAKHGNSETRFSSEVKTILEQHLADIFDGVTITASTSVTSSGGINLTIDVIVREDGIDHSLGYQIFTRGKEIVRIIDLANDGVVTNTRSRYARTT